MARRPARQTKTHNYLLRSKHGYQLYRFLALVDLFMVKIDTYGFATIRKSDGTFAGNAQWAMQTLGDRGIVRSVKFNGKWGIEITSEGREAMAGFVEVDTGGRPTGYSEIWAEINATEVY